MIDAAVREQAFLWLRDQARKYEFIVPRQVLQQGFAFQGQTITLVGPTGIWKPRVCELPLSISTTSAGVYEDGFTVDGLLVYRYRGTDPNHRDNVGLRRLMETGTPFIYFHSVIPGKYVPVYAVRDEPHNLCIHAAVEPGYAGAGVVDSEVAETTLLASDSAAGVRRYVAAYTRRRLHQSAFREKVIAAYRHTCILCQLRHPELLDAAHIIPDSSEGGEPIVQNGLCLCKIHHAAYDQNILGVSPEYRVSVRPDILEEVDGPMLRYGLQALDGVGITLPRKRGDYPDPERLETRYAEFLRAG